MKSLCTDILIRLSARVMTQSHAYNNVIRGMVGGAGGLKFSKFYLYITRSMFFWCMRGLVYGKGFTDESV